jgi:hypothetical protein
MASRFRATAVYMVLAWLVAGCAPQLSPRDTNQQVQKLVGTWVGQPRTHPNDRSSRTRPDALARTLYIRRVWEVDGTWKAEAFFGISGTRLPPVDLEFYTGLAAPSIKFRTAANDIVNLTLVGDDRLSGATTWVRYVQNNAGNDFALILDRFDVGPPPERSTAETEAQVRKLVGGWVGDLREPGRALGELAWRRHLFVSNVWLVEGTWKAHADYGIPGQGTSPVDLEISTTSST